MVAIVAYFLFEPMNKMQLLTLLTWILLSSCSSTPVTPEEPKLEPKILFSPETVTLEPAESAQNMIVNANATWTVSSSQTWCSISPLTGFNGETSVKISAQINRTNTARTAVLTFKAGTVSKELVVTQKAGAGENYVPAGYSLVWNEEFNESAQAGAKPAVPNRTKWSYETGAGGWGNHELQNYIPGYSGSDTCALITNGTLKIIAKKRGTEVLSVRMNSVSSWLYGYFEARLKVPGGKGTWPAFWMLPKNFVSWPLDGEIDIMEYVGYRPDVVQASVHTLSYNHTIGTQKTATRQIVNAETEFHVYAVEWTADKITGYVDGVAYFSFSNDNAGNKNTWPFNAPFYLKLNLAWGGDWGGSMGIDETKLPATYEVDYVRVYQK